MIVGYLAYHFMYGKRGVFSWILINDKITLLRDELDELQKQNAKLENLVDGLHSQSIDPDLLDEQVRKVLGWSEKDEIVVVDPDYAF